MLSWTYPAWRSKFLAQRRSGAAAWREDRNFWNVGAAAGVAQGCGGAQRRKFLAYAGLHRCAARYTPGQYPEL